MRIDKSAAGEKKMATYVLVHGGGHGGWCYHKVARLLRASGHDVHCPTLTGCGERAHLVSPATDLEMHIQDIVNVLHYEDIRDAILVGHSYGGMVITGVADRALGQIGHLVFLDASHPHDGESLVDLSPDMMAYARSTARVVDGVELAMWPSREIVELMGITDPAEQEWMLERLTPHPWKSMEQKLRLNDEPAMRRIPATNINASWSMSRRPAGSVARATQGERVWEVDTGHDLMLTEPEQTAALLLRLAGLPQ
jgi:pimeloyl-ACP methyl ester carboxylesterase